MPYPAQIQIDRLVAMAAEMIEAEGVDQLSLHKLAAALGVTTPSLYRHVASRTALLQAVNERTLSALFAALAAATAETGTAAERLRRLALVYRSFAQGHPVTYGLAFTNTVADLQPDQGWLTAQALPLQALMADVAGEAESLTALRGYLALVHGYVMLELAGQFRRGGDLAAAFEAAAAAYLRGWEAG